MTLGDFYAICIKRLGVMVIPRLLFHRCRYPGGGCQRARVRARQYSGVRPQLSVNTRLTSLMNRMLTLPRWAMSRQMA